MFFYIFDHLLQICALCNFIGNIKVCTFMWHILIIWSVETCSCHSVAVLHQNWVTIYSQLIMVLYWYYNYYCSCSSRRSCSSFVITGWAVAQTCCISKCAKYRKSWIFGYLWEKPHEVIATKHGVSNYVWDPTLTSKYGSEGYSWVVSAHAWNISLWLSFFIFFFVSSPCLQVTMVDRFSWSTGCGQKSNPLSYFANF